MEDENPEFVKSKPTGHMGNEAEKNIRRDLMGSNYPFVQRVGGLPIVYLIIGYIVHRSIFVAVWALFFTFIFHVFCTAYFATRAKTALELCPNKSLGYLWAKAFLFRTTAHHLVMMLCLIYLGWIYFTIAGAIIYIIETLITLSTMHKQGCLNNGRLLKQQNFQKGIDKANE